MGYSVEELVHDILERIHFISLSEYLATRYVKNKSKLEGRSSFEV